LIGPGLGLLSQYHDVLLIRPSSKHAWLQHAEIMYLYIVMCPFGRRSMRWLSDVAIILRHTWFVNPFP
jgi:hypothetical protein